MAWVLWSERNSLVFNHSTTHPHILLARVARLVEEHGTYNARIYSSRNCCATSSPRVWAAPPLDVIKLNVDASLATAGWVGLSVIARDSHGIVLFAAVHKVRSQWPAEIAEAKAIEMALRLGRRYGFQAIIVESDCQVVVNRLSKQALYHADLDIILHNILSSCVDFPSVLWSHVKRDMNSVANNLATLSPFGVEQVWENHFPPEVAPYVLMDNLFLN